MFQTVFRSRDLPAQDGRAAAHGLLGTDVLPIRPLGLTGEPVEVTVRHLDLAPLRLVELAASPAAVLRVPPPARRPDREPLSLLLPMAGGLTVGQSGADTEVRDDELMLYDSSRSFLLRTPADRAVTTVVLVHTPRALLPLPPAGLAALLGRPLPARPGRGFGGMLHQLLAGVASGSARYRPGDRARLGSIAHGLVTAVLAHHLDAAAAESDDAHHPELLPRIDDFVRRRLHDPLLSPGTIAAAHHISVTHLHRLFRSRDTTVAASIRGQRLEKARQDLVDPVLRDVPVHRVAARWGFRNHPSFTRAFRAAFGVSPQECRHGALQVSLGR